MQRKQLSLGIIYHIRKLLRQNFDQLTPVMATEEMSKIEPLNDLDAVLTDLYQDEQELNSMVQQLEHLALVHQTLSTQGAKYRQELTKTEQQIFWLLGFKIHEKKREKTILIVDDVPLNLRLLSATLTRQGYEVYSAVNGMLALSTVNKLNPDLILLDIMMPGMDGYEVCKRFKTDPLTRDIPVIFISASDNVLDKVKAFGVGGADYILKPFRSEEVLARVEHQLKIYGLQKRLEEQNARLHQEIHDRQKAEMLYRSIFENCVDGIFQTTLDGYYLRANLALAHLYGYASPEELIATINYRVQPFYIQPEQRDQQIAHLERQGQALNVESQVQCKDGRVIWVSESICKIKDTNGKTLFYEGIVKDITAQKQSETKSV